MTPWPQAALAVQPTSTRCRLQAREAGMALMREAVASAARKRSASGGWRVLLPVPSTMPDAKP
eukprot:12711156-Alexandrium_andersonii.AAC.1